MTYPDLEVWVRIVVADPSAEGPDLTRPCALRSIEVRYGYNHHLAAEGPLEVVDELAFS